MAVHRRVRKALLGLLALRTRFSETIIVRGAISVGDRLWSWASAVARVWGVLGGVAAVMGVVGSLVGLGYLPSPFQASGPLPPPTPKDVQALVLPGVWDRPLTDTENATLKAAYEEGRRLQEEGWMAWSEGVEALSAEEQIEAAKKHDEATKTLGRALPLTETNEERASLYIARGGSYYMLYMLAQLDAAQSDATQSDATQSDATQSNAAARLDAAETDFRAALELARTFKSDIDRDAVNAAAGAMLGIILWLRGDLDGAEKELARAVEIYEEIDMPGQEGALFALGGVYWERGELDKAGDVFGQAEPLLEASGESSEMLKLVRWFLGWLAILPPTTTAVPHTEVEESLRAAALQPEDLPPGLTLDGDDFETNEELVEAEGAYPGRRLTLEDLDRFERILGYEASYSSETVSLTIGTELHEDSQGADLAFEFDRGRLSDAEYVEAVYAKMWAEVMEIRDLTVSAMPLTELGDDRVAIEVRVTFHAPDADQDGIVITHSAAVRSGRVIGYVAWTAGSPPPAGQLEDLARKLEERLEEVFQDGGPAASPTAGASPSPSASGPQSEADRALAAAVAMFHGAAGPDCRPTVEVPACILPEPSLASPERGIAAFGVEYFPGGAAMVFLGETPEGEWQYWYGAQSGTYHLTALPGEMRVCARGAGLNVRASPSTESGSVALLADNGLVTVDRFVLTESATESSTGWSAGYGWYHLTLPREGWAYSKYLSDASLGDCRIHDLQTD